jgi:TolA-binding protein
MNTVVKGVLGLGLLLVAIFCLQQFRSGFAQTTLDRTGLVESEASMEVTNAVAENVFTNEAAVVSTNDTVAAVTNAVAASSETNSAAVSSEITNAPAATVAAKPAPPAGKSGDKSRSFGWLGGFVAAMLGLAGLVGMEVARWASRRTGDLLFSEDAPGEADPEYDAAEAEWAKGNHLDAIGMMRDYLKKNPSEQYVAIRIAEIYEKDLQNYLAAALELEEVLTRRLSSEKWGWTAIHLANLYSGRMNQAPKAIALLERIIADYPNTGAAKKARERLGVPDAAPAPAEEEAPADDNSSLPKGFTLKKK